MPPTNPTASAGLSPIAIAINPASTGSINLKATLPISLKSLAASVMLPKLLLSAADNELISTANPSIRNDIAIRIPPPTTKGSICETPFISCV